MGYWVTYQLVVEFGDEAEFSKNLVEMMELLGVWGRRVDARLMALTGIGLDRR